MKKIFYISVIVIIISYFLISNFLFFIDDTPRWCKIENPGRAVIGEAFVINVKYRDIEFPCLLFANLIFTNRQGEYRGEKRNQGHLPVISGTGECKLNFVITRKDLKRNDVSMVHVSLSRFEFSGDRNIPIYKRRLVGKSINSDNLQIIEKSKDGILPDTTGISFRQVIKKALKEGYWKKYAGDPSVTGWILTVFYFFDCLFCYMYLNKLRRKDKDVDKGYVRFWHIIIIFILILGINKQLDIQMLIADIGRTYSKSHGWYASRRPFQIQFTSFFASIGLGLLVFIVYALKDIWREVRLALAGISILYGLILTKSISLHRFDMLFYKRIAFINLFDFFEFTGLICIWAGAFLSYRKSE